MLSMIYAYAILMLLLFPIALYAEEDNRLSNKLADMVVNISWNPIEIKPNEMIIFKLEFIKDDRYASSIRYDFIVSKDDQIIKEVKNSFAIDGKASHIVEFPSSGSFSITINLLDDKGDIKDTITFDLKVTPEFPTGMLIVAITLISITIILTRFSMRNRQTDVSI